MYVLVLFTEEESHEMVCRSWIDGSLVEGALREVAYPSKTDARNIRSLLKKKWIRNLPGAHMRRVYCSSMVSGLLKIFKVTMPHFSIFSIFTRFLQSHWTRCSERVAGWRTPVTWTPPIWSAGEPRRHQRDLLTFVSMWIATQGRLKCLTMKLRTCQWRHLPRYLPLLCLPVTGPMPSTPTSSISEHRSNSKCSRSQTPHLDNDFDGHTRKLDDVVAKRAYIPGNDGATYFLVSQLFRRVVSLEVEVKGVMSPTGFKRYDVKYVYFVAKLARVFVSLWFRRKKLAKWSRFCECDSLNVG